MAKVVSFFKTLRRHWKKSVFGISALSYAASYFHTEYRNDEMMRLYCQAAAKYGDVTVRPNQPPYHVTVILNPAANKKKARKWYDRFCAPIFHLAGFRVTLLTTTSDSDARALVETLSADTDALIIAGGDGTVSEAVTGLLRKISNLQNVRKIPIGILPLGQCNSFSNRLQDTLGHFIPLEMFPYASVYAHSLAESSFAVVNNKITNVNVMQVQNLEDEVRFKPVYGLSEFDWGCLRDAHAARDKYWYFGKFRNYIPYVLGSFDRSETVNAIVRYTAPCSGCKVCYKEREEFTDESLEDGHKNNRRWWQVWSTVPNTKERVVTTIDYKNIENEHCGKLTETHVETTEFRVTPEIVDNVPQLKISIGPQELSYFEFIKAGWMKESGSDDQLTKKQLYARQIFIEPVSDTPDPTTDVQEKKTEKWFSVDGEPYEVCKMKTTLLNDIISVFAKA